MKIQRELQTAALIAALFLPNAAGVQEAFGGNSSTLAASAKMTLTARVLEHTSMSVLIQAREVTLTNADIMRGYVNVTSATRVQVRSNNPAGYLLAFEIMDGPYPFFTSVSVSLGGREVQLSQGGGWVPQPSVRGGVTLEVNYRFMLSEDAKPGTYSWPLLISALPR